MLAASSTTKAYLPPPGAMWLLHALPSASLGRLAGTITPAIAVGEAGPHSHVLLHGIAAILMERERAA